MYCGFNLKLNGDKYSDYLAVGESLHAKNNLNASKNLESFLNGDETLEASKIIESWFPPIKADIFLSHSHKDNGQVIALSGWLQENFGLTSFIDSCVWGCSDKLLKVIDNKYCWQGSSKTYNYNKRNRSTAHVYMMLSVALSKMINSCECVMFVNTPNSISSKDYINGNQTDSPWIYSELAMMSLIRKRSLESHRGMQALDESLAILNKVAELDVTYNLYLNHLQELSNDDLSEWQKRCSCKNIKGSKALDVLYELKGNT